MIKKILSILNGSLKAKLVVGAIVLGVGSAVTIGVVVHMNNNEKQVVTNKEDVQTVEDTNEDTNLKEDTKKENKTNEDKKVENKETDKKVDEKATEQTQQQPSQPVDQAQQQPSQTENQTQPQQPSQQVNNEPQQPSQPVVNPEPTPQPQQPVTPQPQPQPTPPTPTPEPQPTYPTYQALSSDAHAYSPKSTTAEYMNCSAVVNSISTVPSFNNEASKIAWALACKGDVNTIRSLCVGKVFEGKLITGIEVSNYSTSLYDEFSDVEMMEYANRFKQQGMFSNVSGLYAVAFSTHFDPFYVGENRPVLGIGVVVKFQQV